MSEPKKKGGKGILKTIKKGFEDTTIAAGLEAEYLKGKTSGFNHPPEIAEQLEIMRGLRDEIPSLRGRLSDIQSYEKTIAEVEGKMGKDFLEAIDKPMQHPDLKRIYKAVGDYKTNLSGKRFQFQVTLEEIKEEWKNLESRDLHDIKGKQDLSNRAISDNHFWTKKGNMAQAKEKDTHYKMVTGELITLIHELRIRKETLVPQYVLRMVQAEYEFYKAAAEYAEQIEKEMLDIGQVQPIPFEGVPGFTNLGGGGGGGGGEQSYQQQTYQQQTYQPQTSYDAPPSIPPQTQPQAKALYPFDAQNNQELTFKPGDILSIISQDGEWWRARLNGREGLIPSNYVQLLD